MHRLLQPGIPSQWYSPSLSPRWVRFWAPFRRIVQRRHFQIETIEVRNLRTVRAALDAGHAVMLAPNHCTYTDPFLLLEACDQLGLPPFIMTAWQVLADSHWLKRYVLRQHGCFSVDRDGVDIRAFRQAVRVLCDEPNPLVIFPEGEMYNVGDRVMPFHEGPASIALTALKQGKRPVALVPCALKYHYLGDPSEKLSEMMARLERSFHWRPRTDLSLHARLLRVAEGALALKELEYLGQTKSGPVTERIGSLCETVLQRLEQRFALPPQDGSVPARVSALRRKCCLQLSGLPEADPRRAQVQMDLDNIFFVVQLFSYPANYVAERPSIERIAESIAKLEEDVFGTALASPAATRGAVIAFGDPILISPQRPAPDAAGLTFQLQAAVQELLQATDVPSLPGSQGGEAPFEVNDVQSRLNATRVLSVLRPSTVDEVQSAIRDARRLGQAICVSGGRHAMGGQQFASGGVLIDLRGHNRILTLDKENCTVDVEAGIQWPELINALLARQSGHPSVLSVRQKQTGVDRVTLAGTLSANAHGRGLRFPPIVSDVEEFDLVDANGDIRTCSRRDNAELFSLAIGGYGLFGVITRVRLRLARRTKVERVVKVIKVADLRAEIDARVAEGFMFGDCQYSTDLHAEAQDHAGVFSCYRPVPDDTPVPESQRSLGEDEWAHLYSLARANKRKAFQTYSAYYLGTSGQVYWSDTHQMSGELDYYTEVFDRQRGIMPNNSEMITEVYVSWDNLNPFLAAVRQDFLEHGVDLTYGTIRFVERDVDTFLAWAQGRQVCVLCNLNIVHTPEGKRKAADDFRRLFDRVVQFGGRYFLTYQRWATREQVEACYPQFVDFLRLKRKYDPGEMFQSEWYRHYRTLFADRLGDASR